MADQRQINFLNSSRSNLLLLQYPEIQNYSEEDLTSMLLESSSNRLKLLYWFITEYFNPNIKKYNHTGEDLFKVLTHYYYHLGFVKCDDKLKFILGQMLKEAQYPIWELIFENLKCHKGKPYKSEIKVDFLKDLCSSVKGLMDLLSKKERNSALGNNKRHTPNLELDKSHSQLLLQSHKSQQIELPLSGTEADLDPVKIREVINSFENLYENNLLKHFKNSKVSPEAEELGKTIDEIHSRWSSFRRFLQQRTELIHLVKEIEKLRDEEAPATENTMLTEVLKEFENCSIIQMQNRTSLFSDD